jgi:PmbA protein
MGQGNPIIGEFSVNVYLGCKIEKGVVVGRVRDVMLAGDVFDVIKDISAISEEREWIGGPRGWVAGLFPYVQIGKLSVTAKWRASFADIDKGVKRIDCILDS